MRVTLKQELPSMTEWWTELPEGFVCPIPPSVGLIFVGREQVVSGRLANTSGS